MNLEEEIEVTCPFCGAVFTTCADTSEGSFSTIEDCQVCCKPNVLRVEYDNSAQEYFITSELE